MWFRPCIDIHNGKVKQIVGGSLTDQGDKARTNFVAEKPADWFAGKYQEDGLYGGHVILLNPVSSPYFEETRNQALRALQTFAGGLQIGGGIRADNAEEYLSAGASHVIVTSYVFSDGRIRWDHLEQLKDAVGKERIVLDLSCRKRDGKYLVVTDRWQKFTDTEVTHELLNLLAGSCAEFLIHGVDVEGRSSGIDQELVEILGTWEKAGEVPVTYAGGIASMEDIRLLQEAGRDRVDFTVGSALDLFGGSLSYEEIREKYRG
nr:phosphoribosylformimino-5-aminoimidazole carboxamide ribotide isomerase [uncultured Sellimonas sp.]